MIYKKITVIYTKPIIFLVGCLATISVTGTCEALDVGEVNILSQDENSWTCYERAINFSANNPEWGIVLISNNKYFYGKGHFMNYKYDNSTLLLYDDYYKSTTTIIGLDQEPTNNSHSNSYYHFYINEKVRRVFKYMADNREQILV